MDTSCAVCCVIPPFNHKRISLKSLLFELLVENPQKNRPSAIISRKVKVTCITSRENLCNLSSRLSCKKSKSEERVEEKHKPFDFRRAERKSRSRRRGIGRAAGAATTCSSNTTAARCAAPRSFARLRTALL